MTVLAGFRTKVLTILGQTITKYSNDVLDEALRETLGEFSRYVPNMKRAEITLAAAGRQVDLSALAGLIYLIQLAYPFTTGEETPTIHESYYLYHTDGSPMIEICGDRVPASGEKLRVVYGAEHTIEDLDTATTTTLRTRDEGIVARGAAAKAAIQRSNTLAEAYGNRSTEYEKIKGWAERMHYQYLSELERLKDIEQGIPMVMNDSRWKLDSWD
ncbi:MAG: hypothetical protein JEZ06_02750 [Anaerolineaceae bacterium]|nr:hypothetical protein [Anaerolineaceae bacterium]